MSKRLFSVLCMLFPMLAFADPVSFAPPNSDYSVVWLADIFGIVDGVLHGTGSQIVGRMFEVFNAGVMALGGIIITYTMLVSTMNTAHEGEMLGKKWSSIWVPVRATAGFAMLIPKASGYCMMQILVMWIVVQGIGAADKIWNAALGYLNRGGVIIQQQQDPTTALTGSSSAQILTEGAATILSGQVCMIAVHKILVNTLEQYQKPGGVCTGNIVDPYLQIFCKEGSVPSFTDTIDIMAAQDNAMAAVTAAASTGQTPPTTVTPIPMPNFPSTNQLYSLFNGLCGSISWNLLTSNTGIFSPSSVANANTQISSESNLSASEAKTALNARAIAVEQMYSDLLTLAQVIVNNDPQLSSSSSPPPSNPASSAAGVASFAQSLQQAAQTPVSTQPWIRDPLGVPLDTTGALCSSNQTPNCTNWGSVPSSASLGAVGTQGSNNAQVLLNGTELQSAVLDYNGVIKPTLTLLAQAAILGSAMSGKSFIQKAEKSGWIMAGTYFFDLVVLNNTNKATSSEITGDTNSGLNASAFTLSTLQNSFSNKNEPCPSYSTQPFNPVFCHLMNEDPSVLNEIFPLFTGVPAGDSSTNSVPSPSTPSFNTSLITTPPTPSTTTTSNSVFGYLQNSLVIQLPGQPPNHKLKFANMMHANFSNTNMSLPSISFACNGVRILFVEFCIGRWIGEIIYNGIVRTLLDFVKDALESLIYGLVMTVFMLPLEALAAIFGEAIRILDVPGINPIVALANMGTYFINFAGKLWFVILFQQVIMYVLMIIGIPMLIIMAMALPIIIAWTAIMVAVGMVTAYYVPLIPYMMFLFGALAWFMAVIEAMVAGPIVALGVVHPEGHDIFGKGEAAIMILMNVFLRPAMMIIGYITAISLSYVGVWMLNAGFDHAISFIQPSTSSCTGGGCNQDFTFANLLGTGQNTVVPGAGSVSGGYTQWAGVFAYFFSILIYTTMYMTLVEKAFSLISVLPDKILRWIGGQPESHGQDASQWMSEAKGKVEKHGEKSGDAMTAAGKSAAGSISTPEQGKIGASGK